MKYYEIDITKPLPDLIELSSRHTRCTSMKRGFQTTDGAPEQFVL